MYEMYSIQILIFLKINLLFTDKKIIKAIAGIRFFILHVAAAFFREET